MGGVNPYLDQAEAKLPRQKYSVTYVVGEEERLVEVDPEALPYSHEGLPGSLLDIACGHGIDIDHACGGVCACSTCHVLVEAGADTCNPSGDAEEDMLDLAPGLTDASRLGCMCVPDGTQSVRVVVPSWNRNEVAEEH
jgi:2Fe-2S ferredoxin